MTVPAAEVVTRETRFHPPTSLSVVPRRLPMVVLSAASTCPHRNALANSASPVARTAPGVHGRGGSSQYNYNVRTTQCWADANLGNYWNPATTGATPVNPYVFTRNTGPGLSSVQGECYWNRNYTPGNLFGGWHTRDGSEMAGGYGFSLYAFQF